MTVGLALAIAEPFAIGTAGWRLPQSALLPVVSLLCVGLAVWLFCRMIFAVRRRKAVAELTSYVERKGESRPQEFAAVCSTLDQLLAELSASKTQLKQSNEKVASLLSDLSDQKRAEIELRKSEAKFRASVENAHDGTLFADADGIIYYRSPISCNFNGYADEERLGRAIFEIVHPDDLPAFQEAWTEMLRSPGATIERTLRILQKSGDWKWIQTFLQNQLQTPEIGAVIVGSRDITERKKAEEKLRASEELFSKVFMNNPASLVLADIEDDLRILNVNETFEKFSGYSRQEAVGHTLRQLNIWVDNSTLEDCMKKVLIEGSLRNLEMRLRTKDGTPSTVLTSADLIYVSGKALLLSAALDITEKKAAEQEIQKLQEEVHQAQKMEALGRLTGCVAHDFNNLLMVILAQAELLQMSASEAKLRERAASIERSAKRAAELTRQLLAFGRKQVLQPAVRNLNEVLRSISEMLGRVLEENIRTRFDFAEELWPVMVDRSQMEQVVLSLCVNSRDAMPEGGELRIRTENVLIEENAVRPSSIPAGRYAMLSITDTGVGMSEEVKAKAFEPFFTTKPRGKGSGLGLSTVFGIVQQSGGYVLLESEPGKGCCAKIYLPAVSGKTVGEYSAAMPLATGLEKNRSVLVVDDQGELRSTVADFLRNNGYQVTEADSLSAALQIVSRRRFDLVLTDVILQDGNGRALADYLKANWSDPKLIYMSGYANDVIVDHGVLAPDVFFLQKPFGGATLLEMIAELLGSSRGT
jgi:PAS domain S-box-containing protein